MKIVYAYFICLLSTFCSSLFLLLYKLVFVYLLGLDVEKTFIISSIYWFLWIEGNFCILSAKLPRMKQTLNRIFKILATANNCQRMEKDDGEEWRLVDVIPASNGQVQPGTPAYGISIFMFLYMAIFIPNQPGGDDYCLNIYRHRSPKYNFYHSYVNNNRVDSSSDMWKPLPLAALSHSMSFMELQKIFGGYANKQHLRVYWAKLDHLLLPLNSNIRCQHRVIGVGTCSKNTWPSATSHLIHHYRPGLYFILFSLFIFFLALTFL